MLTYEAPSWPVVDFHAHFPVAEDDFMRPYREAYIRRFGEAKWGRIVSGSSGLQQEWQAAWSFPVPDEATSDWQTLSDRWLGEVEQLNLTAVAFVTGGGNDLLSRIVHRHPERFIGFAHHDPEAPDAAAELLRAFDVHGFKGYKVFAPLVKRPLGDESLYPVWEAAERNRLPVLVHFGILGGGGGIGYGVNIDPLTLHDVAKAFPGVPFVVPHFGCGYVRELMQLCWACPNVYVDTSGNNEWVRWMPYDLNLDILFRRFYETVGPQRIIFGSDSSWFPRGFALRYLLDQMRVCRQMRMPESDMAAIFGGNAAGLLGLTPETHSSGPIKP